MGTNDLLIEYQIYVDGDLRDAGSIYREWFTFLLLVYEMDNCMIRILVGGEWVTISEKHGS